jgi:hypothetical protein
MVAEFAAEKRPDERGEGRSISFEPWFRHAANNVTGVSLSRWANGAFEYVKTLSANMAAEGSARFCPTAVAGWNEPPGGRPP